MMGILTLAVGLMVAAIVSPSVARANDAYAFVQEYIRELSAIEDVRAKAEGEFKEDPSHLMPSCVRNGTRFQLQLTESIGMLKSYSLGKRFDWLVPNIVGFYQEKLRQYTDMVEICSQMLAGPKPNVDYGALAAEMPKITARLDYIDESLFKASPAIFATLIDEKPDSKNHVSRLTITCAERDALVRTINVDFGSKLNVEKQNWTVSAASVIRDYLIKKGYTCSDEPNRPAN